MTLLPTFPGNNDLIEEIYTEQIDADIYDIYIEMLIKMFRIDRLYEHVITAMGYIRRNPFYYIEVEMWCSLTCQRVKLHWNLTFAAIYDQCICCEVCDRLKIDIDVIRRLEQMRQSFINTYVDPVLYPSIFGNVAYVA